MNDKEVESVKLDPNRETADINESNNSWGSYRSLPLSLPWFNKNEGARGQSSGINPMQKAEEEESSYSRLSIDITLQSPRTPWRFFYYLVTASK